MRENGIMLGLFAETPLHPGTGSTTGVVDLPVQRERHTGFPIIQASGIKGAMRERAEREKGKKMGESNQVITNEEINIIFGPENSDHAGALAITDARILAFPVRALTNVYVWVTCPAVISRLERDMALLKKSPSCNISQLSVDKEKALISNELALSEELILEELLFTVDPSKKTAVSNCITEILQFIPPNGVYATVIQKMKKDLVVIHDDDFTHLVKNATQVSARIVLKENKTSENLWYEESIPPDTLFYTLLMASKPRGGNSIADADGVLAKVKVAVSDYLQIGGNETVGMGWCALQYCGGDT
ncbi:MAG: type III-B CRISPR module RAMP protein Cmr4 [Candidatus Brocadia sp. UTAMX2]|jgi:CRISPR-associated protein Cmr4|nr:MAG: type III-B CRISPR module RAMP protein Cmr4 [Candidatus Brocadia sp. UTAMX2]